MNSDPIVNTIPTMWPRLKNHQQYVNQNILMKMRTGSHLYGTNIATSDEDYVGIFSPHPDTIFGFTQCNEVDCSIHSKSDDGRNTPEAIDIKMYEMRKFLHLLSQGNPNIMDMIFVNDENLIQTSDIYKIIRDHQKIFVHKGIYSRFIGYAFAQKQKMIIKSENVNCFIEFIEILEKQTHQHDPVSSINFKNTSFSSNGEYVNVGDIKIQLGVSIINASKTVKNRYAKASYRKDTILKHGYDTKFGMHLIRLILEGISLMSNGYIKFPLPEAQDLLSIRNGKYTHTEIIQWAEQLETEAQQWKQKSSIPEHIDLEKYRELYIYIVIRCMQNFSI